LTIRTCPPTEARYATGAACMALLFHMNNYIPVFQVSAVFLCALQQASNTSDMDAVRSGAFVMFCLHAKV
jgi:hypothetical protein